MASGRTVTSESRIHGNHKKTARGGLRRLNGRKGKNVSLGNLPRMDLVYLFGADAGAIEDDRKGVHGEGHLKSLKIAIKMDFDDPVATLQITRQFPEQQKHRGGGF